MRLSDTKLSAFTIIELLVAIGVIGIIVAVGTPYGLSRMCDARHNAFAASIDTELFNARLFALENNRYVRVNLEPAVGGGVSIDRFYSTSIHSSCLINPTASGSILLSTQNFDTVESIGFSNSYFCIDGDGRLAGFSYNAPTLVEHTCASRSYLLRINYTGGAGFFFIEEQLPLMTAGSWQRI